MSVDILDRVYDAYSGEMGQRFMRETQRRIHWMCASAQGARVIDVGCSQGLVPILLGREGRWVVGIDNNASSLQQAEQHLAGESIGVRKLVTFIQGDFATHAFEAPFDCVLMGEILEHLLDPERFLAAAAERLTVGGRLVVTVPFGINDHVDHKHTFYLLEPYRLLSKHFDVIEIELLGKWLGLVAVKRPEDGNGAFQGWSDTDLRRLEEAFHRIERGLVDDVGGLQAKLDDANAKYRATTEEVSRLKREAAHHNNERQNSERARVQVEADLKAAQQGAGQASITAATDLAQELSHERAARHAHEVTLARFEERLNHSEQLRRLELEVRNTEIARIDQLRGQLEERLQEVTRRLSQERDEAARQVAETRASLATLTAERDDLIKHLEASQRGHAALESQLADDQAAHAAECANLSARLESARLESSRLMQEWDSLRVMSHDAQRQADDLAQQLGTARNALRETATMTAELSRARERVAELEAERAAAHQAESDLERRRERRERQLVDEALSLKAREQTQAAERQRLIQRAAEAKMEQYRADLAAAHSTVKKLGAQLDGERRQRVKAEQRAVHVRNTLSFQLGYELIHGFKSRDGLLRLPQSLWHLQQEAARRRRERDTKHEVPVRPTTAHVASVQPAAEMLRAAATSNRPASSHSPIKVAEFPRNLSQLRVACVHDEFTFASFAPECQLLQLTPANWQVELETFRPQMLFVESAWRGKDDAWTRKISHRSQELVDILAWCKSQQIPSIFWNKEDPVHYRTFLNTAKLFDWVFTTDIDCVARYKRALGHERVGLLPFAVQPKAHNPLEKYQRKDAIAFAGAYYARYPERQADLARFVDSLASSPGLEIFDRNHGKSDPDYQFPERYRQHIVGTLSFDEIDKAYKGYRYALNLNSIKASQTMFARRVFELLGSNTVTISNFSRGVRLMFGDLVITTDSGERARTRLEELGSDSSTSRRFRLAGLRKVLHEHTYGHRLRVVTSHVFGQVANDGLPEICVLAHVRNSGAATRIISTFGEQAYPRKRLLLIAEPSLCPAAPARQANVEWVGFDQASPLDLHLLAPGASHFAVMVSGDHYGSHYLTDLALATLYSSASVIGKVAHYRLTPQGQLSLTHDGSQYRSARSVAARASLVRREVLRGIPARAWLSTLEAQTFCDVDCLGIDEFNYCEDGSGLDEQQAREVSDLPRLDHGLPLSRMLAAAAIEPPETSSLVVAPMPQIDVARLAKLFKPSAGKPIAISLEGGQLLVQSSLADETHEYIYAKEAWSPAELGLPGPGKLHFEATPGLNVQLGVMFLDQKKQRIGHKLCQPGSNETITLPLGTAWVQLALRIYGPGTTKLSALLLDHGLDAPDVLFGRGDYLLITNRYPSDQDLYRNGFVHRRVLDYAKRGHKVDVFRLADGQKHGYYEFDGVDVISGGNAALDTLLRSNTYKAILVHFLDPRMWQSIAPWLDRTRVLIWAHGAEIQAWHRRAVHFGSPAQLEAAKAESEPRRAFWRNVFESLPSGSKTIFVSQHFAQEVQSDLGVELPRDRYEVIHNVIDTSLFGYVTKPSEQRKRILSIRPHTSRIYANDLAVAAVLALSREPWFHELDIHFIGDGPLFNDTVEPLRGFPNVHLDQRFIPQSEIAKLHREYGVFLCPSRGDTQGVSRDEAMSSGLVPVTTMVGAIPEFVDADSGILAPAEDAAELAAGIARLYEDPELFLRLSAQAAQRVRSQSSPGHTTEREVALMLPRVPR